MSMNYRTLCIMLLVMLGLITQLEPAASLKSPKGFVVVDSTGKTIGPVLSVDETLRYAVVAFTANGLTFALRVDSGVPPATGFTGNLDSLLFESADCTGTPYMDVRRLDTLLADVVVEIPGRTLYRQDDTAAHIFTNSLLGGGDAGPGECSTFPQTREFLGAVAIPVVDLSTLFTPPFHVRPQK